MRVARAFISFDFDHNEREKNLFVGQGKHPDTPWEIADWSAKEAMPQNQWERIVEGKIGQCHMVIVLVGKSMASATGVAKEIQMALRNDVPFFGVYVDDAEQHNPLPVGLPKSRIITWTWPNVANAVNQMMGEGKNGRNEKSFNYWNR